jgi:hypothetical protein
MRRDGNDVAFSLDTERLLSIFTSPSQLGFSGLAFAYAPDKKVSELHPSKVIIDDNSLSRLSLLNEANWISVN